MQIDSGKQRVGSIKQYGGVAITILIAFLIGFELSSYFAEKNTNELRMLSQSNDNLVQENQQLNAQINQQKIQLDVLSLSLTESNENLQQLQSEKLALKEQLSFFQRVMAPELTAEGFFVQAAEIIQSQIDQSYQLNLMLVQNERVRENIKGELSFDITGYLGEQLKTFKESDVLLDNQSLNYSFRYFQQMQLNLRFEDGFMPEYIVFSTDVYKFNRRRGSYTTRIEWRDAFVELD